MKKAIFKKAVAFFVIAVVFFLFVSSYNLEFFYFSIDLFTIVIGLMIFILAINSKAYTKRTTLLLMGVLYLYSSCYDIAKLVMYHGVAVQASTNLSVSWFTVARVLEAIGLLLVLSCLKESAKKWYVFIHITGTVLLITVFFLINVNMLFDFYDTTLTVPTRVIHYIVSVVFLSLIYFIWNSEDLKQTDKELLSVALILKALSSLLFAQVVVWGDFLLIVSNMTRFLSYAIMYLVFVQNIVYDPYMNVHSLFMKKEKELISLSELDSMTGLYNHSTTFKKIEEMILNVGQQFDGVCVILFDIDNFKQINDSYGHIKGDEVLVEFTQKLNTLDYQNTIVGRYGGDEFVMAIPNITKELVQKVFDDICFNLDDIHKRTKVRITISAGVVFWKIGDNATDLIRRADIKLYDSKKRGKNQFAIWENK